MRLTRIDRSVLAALLTLAVAAVPPLLGQDLTTFVAASDGIMLATDVYLPAGDGPWPVVLMRTPYGKQDCEEDGEDFSAAGMVLVAQDTRGRFASGGIDTVFRDDGEDGRTTIAWIASQPWCDGNIGTFGGSALGVTQYMLAPGAGRELKAIMVGVASPNLYRHAFVQHGAIRESLNVNWLEGQGALAFYGEVRAHRMYDDWWAVTNVTHERDQVDCAGLHLGGWYDVFSQGTIDGFSSFQHSDSGAGGKQYLIMGPWTHELERATGELVYPIDADLEIGELMADWFVHWLTAEDTGVREWPAALIYLMGAVDEPGAPGNEWLELSAWPPVNRSFDLYLAADGALTSVVPDSGSIVMIADPDNPVPTVGGCNLFPELIVNGRAMGSGPHDQRLIEVRDDVQVFTTAVLTEPLTVMGAISCTLWIDPDTPDLDLTVRLSDVYPDGRSMLVSDGIQRARFRCGDDQKCLLTPGQPTRITVDLWSTALVFNAGHKIRVLVAGSNSPRFEVNPNHGGDLNGDEPAVVARPRLLFGAQHPSRLELPVPTSPRHPGPRPDEELLAVSR